MNKRPWFQSYDQEVPQEIEFPQINIYQFLEESARRYPQAPCTHFKGARITYREMDELTDRLAAGLASLGVRKGDRVGIFMPNSPQFVIAYFAILKAGGIVVAINPLYSPREIEHHLNDAGVELVFVMSNFYTLLKEVQPRTKVRALIVTNLKESLRGMPRLLFTLFLEKSGGFRIKLQKDDLWMQGLIRDHSPAERQHLDVRPEDPAIFQYSGGTTGDAKAAVLMHSNIVANSIQLHHWLVGIEEGKEVMLMGIPLFHVYGMVCGMGLAVHLGAAMVMIPDPRDLDDLLSSIDRYQATLFPGVPTLFNAINKYPKVLSGKYNLKSLKGCMSGSAPLTRETRERFIQLTGSRLFEGYGLSEAPTATHCTPINTEYPTGTIGLPLPGVDVRIVDVDDGSKVLPVGEIGELMVSGPQVMQGYYKLPGETDHALKDGWLHTGDIAYMDPQGYFFLVDRKKEMIKPGGYQVWPREVEDVILENPKVQEVGVAGVPDAYRGETVKAWVVLKSGEQASEAEIRDWCRARLAKFKVPTSVEFRSELPKSQLIGKLLRRELVREHLEALQSKENVPSDTA